MILPTLTSSDLGDGESSCWVLWSDASCVYKGPLNQKVPLSQRWVFLIQTRTIVILVHISAICTWKHCISKNHWNFFFIRYLSLPLGFTPSCLTFPKTYLPTLSHHHSRLSPRSFLSWRAHFSYIFHSASIKLLPEFQFATKNIFLCAFIGINWSHIWSDST